MTYFSEVMLRADSSYFRTHLFWIARTLRAPWLLGRSPEQTAKGHQNRASIGIMCNAGCGANDKRIIPATTMTPERVNKNGSYNISFKLIWNSEKGKK